VSTDEPQTRSWWNRVFRGAHDHPLDRSSASPEITDADDLVELFPDAAPPTAPSVEPPHLYPSRGTDQELRERLAHAEQRAEADRVRAAGLERDYENLLEAHARLEQRAQHADELVATLRHTAETAKLEAHELREALAQAAGKSDEIHKARRALADRDKRPRSQAAELSTLRIVQRKAADTERDLRRELTELAGRTTRGIEELEQELGEAKCAHAAAEQARETDAAQLAELRRAVAKSDAAYRALSTETSQLRREQSVTQRSCREATEAATQAREQLAAALRDKAAFEAKCTEGQRRLAKFRARDARSSAQLEVLRAFATQVIGIGAESLWACVGDRAGLPLARSWRRHPPKVALGSRAATGPEDLVSQLREHLLDLGIVEADGRTAGEGLIFECTLMGDRGALASEAPGHGGPALWLAHYFRAWLHSAHGCEFAVAGIRADDAGRTFSVTLQ
jgi:hypothetical protein